MNSYIGMDPGQTGGIALVHHNGVLSDVIPMPVIDKEVQANALAQVLTAWRRDTNDRLIVVIEEVHSMPGQGVSSTFKFGKSFGILIGVTQALGFPMVRARPQDWKKEFGLIGKDKDASRSKATELWPSMSQHWNLKKDNGKTDAALIAEWGRRTL